MHAKTRPISPLVLALSVVVILMFLALIGLIKAELWTQVTIPWEHGWTIANWHAPPESRPAYMGRSPGIENEAHRLRYFLVFPILWSADALSIDANTAYTFIMPFLAGTSTYFALRAAGHNTPQARLSLFNLIPLALIPTAYLFMDGRLIFALTGTSILLALHLGQAKRFWILTLSTLVALWFCSVSTGTFVAAFVSLFVLCGYRAFCEGTWKGVLCAFAPFLLAAIIFSYDMAAMLSKAIGYYGTGVAGVIHMLEHGFGKVFLSFDAAALISGGFLFIVLTASAFALLTRYSKYTICLALLIGLGFSVGTFGWSTLFMTLPAIAMMASHVITSFEHFSRVKRG
jgi:hypothetical protein